jgi:hypothetical protein
MIKANLNTALPGITSLPDNLIVEGYLDLRSPSVTKLIDNFKASRDRQRSNARNPIKIGVFRRTRCVLVPKWPSEDHYHPLRPVPWTTMGYVHYRRLRATRMQQERGALFASVQRSFSGSMLRGGLVPKTGCRH